MAACDAASIVPAAIRAACDARPPRKTVAAVVAAVSAVFRPASTAVANLRRQSQVPEHAPAGVSVDGDEEGARSEAIWAKRCRKRQQKEQPRQWLHLT